MEKDDPKLKAEKKKKEFNNSLSKLLWSQEGRDFILYIRRMGGAGSAPVFAGDSEKTQYTGGRFSLMNELMTALQRADFDGYLKMLEYENNLKKAKKDGR